MLSPKIVKHERPSRIRLYNLRHSAGVRTNYSTAIFEETLTLVSLITNKGQDCYTRKGGDVVLPCSCDPDIEDIILEKERNYQTPHHNF